MPLRQGLLWSDWTSWYSKFQPVKVGLRINILSTIVHCHLLWIQSRISITTKNKSLKKYVNTKHSVEIYFKIIFWKKKKNRESTEISAILLLHNFREINFAQYATISSFFREIDYALKIRRFCYSKFPWNQLALKFRRFRYSEPKKWLKLQILKKSMKSYPPK